MTPRPLKTWLAPAVLALAPITAQAQSPSEQSPAPRAIDVPVLAPTTPFLESRPEPQERRRLRVLRNRPTLLHLAMRCGAQLTAPGFRVVEVDEEPQSDLALGFELRATVPADAPEVYGPPAPRGPLYRVQPSEQAERGLPGPRKRSLAPPPIQPAPGEPDKAPGATDPAAADASAPPWATRLLKDVDSLRREVEALRGDETGDRASELPPARATVGSWDDAAPAAPTPAPARDGEEGGAP